ncbi:YdcH family protein [Thioclava sp. GXIMD4216]|uniref:YdcH family protein n=1 Tax=Thioclava litoralis TaxID=3076557 RepID=A0ABZ1E3P0_9RHOB|nr:YdcH family protein [Thioclava sp. FTW29]
MSLSSHITELRKKHQALSAEVERATRNPGFPGLEIAQMKKQKLQIKQEIARLEQA